MPRKFRVIKRNSNEPSVDPGPSGEVAGTIGGVPLVDLGGNDGGGSDTGGDTGAPDSGGAPAVAGARRGRPPGSRRARSVSVADFSGVEKILVSFHAMAAGFLQCPDLILPEEEAKEIVGAIANVAKHYTTSLIDEKTAAWINAAGIVGFAYGTRIFALQKHAKAKQAAKVRQMPNPTPDVKLQ